MTTIKNNMIYHIIETYKDKKNEWRWRIIHRNTNIILFSSEGYKNFKACQNVLDGILSKNRDYILTIEPENHQWKGISRYKNEILAITELYKNKSDCENALSSLFFDHYQGL